MSAEEANFWAELNERYGTDFKFDEDIEFPNAEETQARMICGDTFDGATQNYGKKVAR